MHKSRVVSFSIIFCGNDRYDYKEVLQPRPLSCLPSPLLRLSNVNLLAPLFAGSKVISRKLSLDNLAEVESVLQRPPLIWDNLHANDYDSRRLFLGPFKGREPQLRSHLSGLLLNPNCEFEANYIPLHSLGSWFRTGNDESKGEREKKLS